MIPNFVRRQPLLAAALFLSAAIVFQNYFLPNLWLNRIPKNEASYFARGASTPVLLGGVVVSEVEERETFYGGRLISFILENKKLWRTDDKAPQKVAGRTKVYLSDSAEAVAYGDEVVIKGELKIPKGRRNPGCFDKRAYLDRQGIRTVFYGDKKFSPKVLRRGRGNFILAKAIEAKQFLSKSLSDEFDKRDAGFLKALFLGERSGLEEEFKDLFIKTGTMHILAVSGFNIGFLSLTLFFLLRPFPVSINFKLCFVLAAIWLYCLIVGWQAPVVRASFMASLFILGKLLGRKTNVLNTLGFAALVILMLSPKQLFDVGFQLSFLAVFGIVRFVPQFTGRPQLLPNETWSVKEKIIHYLRELFWVSFVCLVITFPVTVQNFYIATPLSLAANMIVVPVSFLLFFTGAVFFITFWWLPKFLALAPVAMKFLMKFFTGSLYIMENLPGSYFIVGKLHFILWALLAAGIAFFLLDRRIKNPIARALALALFILMVCLAQDISRHFHRPFRMTALDVGQGDAVYFEFRKGGNMLIDAGRGLGSDQGRWVVAPFLKSKGVRTIDALVLSHPHEDHLGGMRTVLNEFRVKNFVDGMRPYNVKDFAVIEKMIRGEKLSRLSVYRGQSLGNFRDVKVEILNPPHLAMPGHDVNNDSLVLKVLYGGESFLLTGDLGEEGMADVLKSGAPLESTVLKVPHHGSKLKEHGEAFVRKAAPRISVVSVGEKNRYKHPSPETLETLNAVPGNKVFRTDRDTAVEIVSDGVSVVESGYAK